MNLNIFWCHLCKEEAKVQEFLCTKCGYEYIEEVDEGQPHPQTFAWDLWAMNEEEKVKEEIRTNFVEDVIRILSGGVAHIRECEEIDAECSVCFEPIRYGMALQCHHCFHRNCLLPWISEHNTCPYCRSLIT